MKNKNLPKTKKFVKPSFAKNRKIKITKNLLHEFNLLAVNVDEVYNKNKYNICVDLFIVLFLYFIIYIHIKIINEKNINVNILHHNILLSTIILSQVLICCKYSDLLGLIVGLAGIYIFINLNKKNNNQNNN